MYKLKYFQCREQREIHGQVNGHNRWWVFSAFAFYFWPRIEALEQISFILVHCDLVQISEQSWSPWPGFLLDENGLKFALHEGTWEVPTTEGSLVHGIRLELVWSHLLSPESAWVLRPQQWLFPLQVCCSCFASLFFSWISSDHLKHVD